jgi:hypothetical protein
MKVLEDDLQLQGECFPAQNQQILIISGGTFEAGYSEVGTGGTGFEEEEARNKLPRVT